MVVVSDGAGGLGGGTAAADLVVHQSLERSRRATDASAWLNSLDALIYNDRRAGEATAIVLTIDGSGCIEGASVGDSTARVISNGHDVELTEHQQRKPLLGTGMAHPVAFRGQLGGGVLLVATDGLRMRGPLDVPRASRLEHVARSLVDSARLPSGQLEDDVCVVLVRSTCSTTS